MSEFWNSVSSFFTQMYITFISVMRSFSLIDLIDILVMAYIIYKVIQFAKGSRAKRLLYGVLLIIVVWLISSQIEMRALSTLLSAVLAQGVVALAVIFQPELRSALEMISKSKFTFLRNDYSNSQEMERCIESICVACADFQNTRTGAILVFERDTKLNDIIKTGTIIDSRAKPELIRNVFFPNTPLHDGAMVIREGRLYAAGCILPLTTNLDVSKALGTRHRAALGMSENSDAVVVVVSEETGIISVAQGGVLTRNYNQYSLSDFLKETLIVEEDESKKSFLALFKKKGEKQDEK